MRISPGSSAPCAIAFPAGVLMHRLPQIVRHLLDQTFPKTVAALPDAG